MNSEQFVVFCLLSTGWAFEGVAVFPFALLDGNGLLEAKNDVAEDGIFDVQIGGEVAGFAAETSFGFKSSPAEDERFFLMGNGLLNAKVEDVEIELEIVIAGIIEPDVKHIEYFFLQPGAE